MHKLLLFCTGLFTLLFSVPQLVIAQAPAMDDSMVKDGKIYVVVAVLVVIFIGIILFLLRMERKLGRLERHEKGS
jgi:hypothetical protein